MSQKKTEVIYLRTTSELNDKVTAFAEARSMTRNGAISYLLDLGLKRSEQDDYILDQFYNFVDAAIVEVKNGSV